MVSKVARRVAPRNRQRSRANTKEGAENTNNTTVEQSESRNARRTRRGKRNGRSDNGYFVEQGELITLKN